MLWSASEYTILFTTNLHLYEIYFFRVRHCSTPGVARITGSLVWPILAMWLAWSQQISSMSCNDIWYMHLYKVLWCAVKILLCTTNDHTHNRNITKWGWTTVNSVNWPWIWVLYTLRLIRRPLLENPMLKFMPVSKNFQSWGYVYKHRLPLTPAWMNNNIHFKVWDDITNNSRTSRVQPFKCGNG